MKTIRQYPSNEQAQTFNLTYHFPGRERSTEHYRHGMGLTWQSVLGIACEGGMLLSALATGYTVGTVAIYWMGR